MGKLGSLSLSTRISGIIAIVSLVIISIGTTTLNLSSERLQSSYNASKQFQLVELLDSVVLDLTRAEAQEREYVLTGNKEALEPYRQAFVRIDQNLARLKDLLSGNSRYSMLLDELMESVSFRKSCAEEVIQVHDTVSVEEALSRSCKFDEARLTKHVEWLAKDVSRNINQEMQDRLQELDKDSLATMAGIAFILASALLALLIVIFGVNRYVMERQRAEISLKQAQKAITEKEARLRALVETAPDAIVVFKPNGEIESVNHVAEFVFGQSMDQMVNCPLTRFLPGFVLEEHEEEHGARLLSGQQRQCGGVREQSVVRIDGTILPVDVSMAVVNLGTERIYMAIIRDISERKAVEERVKDFYSMVSHELRTPLASIRTALGLLEALKEELPQKVLPVISIAAQETDRLMRLINDILDMRKIEAGKLELICDVYRADRLVVQAVEAIESLAAVSSVKVSNQVLEPVEIFCDQDRTLQVLSNILSNALKYSPSAGTVTVSSEVKGSELRISVTDQGPGIPQNQRHKLFGRFEQLRSMDGKNRAGSGLGLAIAKAIVEAQDGQVGVDQSPAGGSVFWFTVPIVLDEPEDEDEDSENGNVDGEDEADNDDELNDKLLSEKSDTAGEAELATEVGPETNTETLPEEEKFFWGDTDRGSEEAQG
jgi:PAS domain S-box-containing protein